MRNRVKQCTLAVIAALLLALVNSAQAAAAVPLDVVLRWAPVIGQRNFSTQPVDRANVFTRVDFDQDWRTNNNFLNIPFVNAVEPAVYYSLVESTTHYFVGYYLYYPRYGQDRENDMIGVMLALRKPGTAAENIDMILSYSNSKWKRWQRPAGLAVQQRLVVTVRAESHQIETVGTLFKPGVPPVYPDCDNLPAKQNSYRLTNLAELWQRRNDIGAGRVFSRWGYFDGYYYKDTAVPWEWTYRQVKWLSSPGELRQAILHLKQTAVVYQNNEYRCF